MKLGFWGYIFEIEMFMRLHVLTFHETENNIFSGMQKLNDVNAYKDDIDKVKIHQRN